MKQELKDIEIEAIYRGRNVRLPGLAHEEELYQDIKANGITKHMLVFGVGVTFEVIQGHLRDAALDRLAEEEPARFKELYPSGKIQCLVLSDCTFEQAQLEKLDHGQENPLTNPMEVQLVMNFLLDANKTEAQIAVSMAGLMNRVSPMKANKKKELDQLNRDIEMYQKEGRFVDVAEKQRQAAQLLLDYRKGKIQNCKAVYSCPHIVMAAMWYKATGGERNWEGQLDIDIPADTYLPSVLQIDAIRKKLAVAFEKDLLIKENGLCPYNKRIPGPNFNSEWTILCDKSSEKESSEAPVREKAYSKQNLIDDEKKWQSNFGRLLCQAHRRVAEVDPNLLAKLDKIAFFGELVADRAPDEWVELEKLAKGLEKEVNANNKEVEAQAKGTEATPPPETAETAATIVNRPDRASKA